ncbi:MAG: flagellar basal body-associated FliL family protein [Candidatus Hinthialibacter antarcticus]|nr:flagellar basal body-associated FliL family protein [Candidatus Hinthialibacter antarcticus]
MGDAPEQADVQQEEQPKSKLPFIIAGFGILLVVIGVVAYMMMSGGAESDVPTPEFKNELGYMYTFPKQFVGNLSPPDDQYMFTADVTLEILPRGKNSESDALTEIGASDSDDTKNMMPVIKQTIQEELASQTRVEINGRVGRDNLRNRIKNEINLKLTKGEIKAVYLTVVVP